MATDDFFRARLDQMIDMRHPLAVLTQGQWRRCAARSAVRGRVHIRWLLRAIARGGIAALMFVLQLLALMRGCAEEASSGVPRPHLVTASM